MNLQAMYYGKKVLQIDGNKFHQYQGHVGVDPKYPHFIADNEVLYTFFNVQPVSQTDWIPRPGLDQLN